MTIKHKPTVEAYVSQHASMLAALENLREFLESMPAPDEDGHIPNIDYGYTGSVGRMFELLSEASLIADEMTK